MAMDTEWKSLGQEVQGDHGQQEVMILTNPNICIWITEKAVSTLSASQDPMITMPTESEEDSTTNTVSPTHPIKDNRHPSDNSETQ